MIPLFLRFEFGKIIKYFKTRTSAKIITACLFLVVFLLLGVGIYNFFFSGFRFIYYGIEEVFRLPVTLFIYETFLLVLAGVIVMSSLVSGLFSLFKGGDNVWFMSSPAFGVYPKLVFIRSLLSSSWPLVVIFLPVLFAFAKLYHVSIFGIVTLLLSVFLLLVIANATTLSVLVGIGALYRVVSRRYKKISFTFQGFAFLLFLFIATNLGYLWHVVRNVDLIRLFKAEDADAVVTFTTIGEYFSLFPTHPLAMQLIALQTGNWQQVGISLATLVLLAGVVTFAWFFISRFFFVLWQVFQENNGKQDRDSTKVIKPILFKGGPLRAIFTKEFLVSKRNWKGALWFAFLIFIWLVQIGGSLILDNNIRRSESDITQVMIILQTLQFVIATYFIASFTLRFAFPSFSVEKKTAWILGTAPISFTNVFFGKYLFYTTLFVFVGVVMNHINALVLGITIDQVLYSTGFLVVSIVGIVTFGLVLGALFPNKDTDDPEAISTSIPGLFFTAISLLYSACGAYILRDALKTDGIESSLLFVFVTTVFVFGALFFVYKKFHSKGFYLG